MRNRRTPRASSAHRARRTSIPGVAVGTSVVALVLAAIPGIAFASENLELIPDLPMLFALVVAFAAMVYPVNQLIFKPIFHALDERASRIAGARHRAEHIGAEADGVLAQYEESIREARSAAEAARKDLVASARAEQVKIATTARSDAEAMVEKARTELGGALGDARAELRSASQELGRLAAERILGRPIG